MKKILLSLIIILLLLMIASCTTNVQDTQNTTEIQMEETKMTVMLETSMGNIEIELNEKKAPISAKNFLDYVNEGYYDGLIFHRVIPNFMIQTGGFNPDMTEKETKAPIKNEADNGLKNEKYTLAMARTGVVDSATSQFFINTNNNEFLNNGARDFGYAVFGKVVSGIDVVDKIGAVATGNKAGFQDVPVENVVINKAYVK